MADVAEKKHGSRGKPPVNFTMIQFFEWYAPGGGTHWNLYRDLSPSLASMGITAAWLPPPCKSAGGDASVGYDPYDLWDLGEFDQKGSVGTHWGTKEELIEAIKVAKENGVISYLDAVLNHRMGADEEETFLATEVDQNDRLKTVGDMRDIKAWTKYTFPARADKYSSQKLSSVHFTGVDYDSGTGKTGIFKIQGDGKKFSENVGKEGGNMDFLMGCDLDYAHGEVREDALKWGPWILKETGASGFRFDAVPHIDEPFIHDFVKTCREATGQSSFCVGELLAHDYQTLDDYLNKFGTQFSLFDAPLHFNFKEAGEARENYDLRTIYDGTMTQKRPVDSVTFVDNHDTQIGQTVESWVAPWMKILAYAIILLRIDGYPCVFFGDLYGCGGENPQPPVTQLESIIRTRARYAMGAQNDWFDHPNCIGWVRRGDEDHPAGCAVVLCNGTAEGTKKMDVGKEHAGEKWTDVLGWTQGEITIGEDGWAEFRCPSESIGIWVNKDAEFRDEFGKGDAPEDLMKKLSLKESKESEE